MARETRYAPPFAEGDAVIVVGPGRDERRPATYHGAQSRVHSEVIYPGSPAGWRHVVRTDRLEAPPVAANVQIFPASTTGRASVQTQGDLIFAPE